MEDKKSTHGVSTKYGAVSAATGSFHEDEPVFIIRAADSNAIRTIARYRDSLAGVEGVSSEFLTSVDQVISQFSRWAAANPKFVKLPD